MNVTHSKTRFLGRAVLDDRSNQHASILGGPESAPQLWRHRLDLHAQEGQRTAMSLRCHSVRLRGRLRPAKLDRHRLRAAVTLQAESHRLIFGRLTHQPLQSLDRVHRLAEQFDDTSPCSKPAASAGLPGMTRSTRTPCSRFTELSASEESSLTPTPSALPGWLPMPPWCAAWARLRVPR